MVVVRTQLNQHTDSLLKSLEALLWNRREVRTFRALVALFLDTELRTTLQNITGISASIERAKPAPLGLVHGEPLFVVSSRA